MYADMDTVELYWPLKAATLGFCMQVIEYIAFLHYVCTCRFEQWTVKAKRQRQRNALNLLCQNQIESCFRCTFRYQSESIDMYLQYSARNECVQPTPIPKTRSFNEIIFNLVVILSIKRY